MNMLVNNTTAEPTTPIGAGSDTGQIVKETLYWVTATIALGGNLLVCLFFFRNSALLRKPYNVFILSLAVTDFVTAINLFVATAYLVAANSIERPSNHIAAEIFCRIVYSRFLLFTFGTASIYVCLCLTLERWFAVVHPTKYVHAVNIKRALIALAISWILGILACFDNPSLQVVYKPNMPVDKRCSWRARSPSYNRVTGTIGFIMKAFIPTVGIIVLYLHMWIKIKTASQVTQMHGAAVRKKITRIAFVASIAIIICWVPGQINFYLYKWGISRAANDMQFYFILLGFFNSCINPFLYGITSQKYRKGYMEILSLLLSPFRRLLPSPPRAITPTGAGRQGGVQSLSVPPRHQKQDTDENSFSSSKETRVSELQGEKSETGENSAWGTGTNVEQTDRAETGNEEQAKKEESSVKEKADKAQEKERNENNELDI